MYDLFGNPIDTQNKCKVYLQNGGLQVITPYNPQFVALIKSLPSTARRFDPISKAWLVDTQYGEQIRDWILKVFGEDIGSLATSQVQPAIETRILDVWYLARTKPVGDEFAANGMNSEKQWQFLFPEHVLRRWFEGTENRLTSAITLYGILGIQRNALGEDIKSAYRRAARQWHPDVCKEPNAQEMFLKIKEAYELLIDPSKRARYDAGLALEATLSTARNESGILGGYRSPLRCGYILAKGSLRIGRFVVEKIEAWDDITSDQGVLVASWPAGANEPVWQWV